LGISLELIPLFIGSFIVKQIHPLDMSQIPYTFEYEIKASPKVLFPYLSTPSGLQQWFADKVIVRGSSELHFYWDNENHPAHVLPAKANKSVKFDFKKEGSEPGKHIIEMSLDVSEISNTTYLTIIDGASTFKTDADATELWDYLIDKLKEIVGS
jgi:uncharacterized protein YndB with AHSA1/START domain